MTDLQPDVRDRLSPRPLEELVQRVAPLNEDDDLATAGDRLADAGGGLPVVDGDGRLVGYFGERDLLGSLFPAWLQEFRNTEFLTRDFPSLVRKARTAAATRVGEHMSRNPVAIDVDDSELHAAELFLHHHLRTLAVVTEGGRVTGVLRLADMLQSLLRACGAAPARSTPPGETPPGDGGR